MPESRARFLIVRPHFGRRDALDYWVEMNTPPLSVAAVVFLLFGTDTFTIPEALPSKSDAVK